MFADDEPLNSTAVYFSLNRELIIDGSTKMGHGTQFTYDIQHMLTHDLQTFQPFADLRFREAFTDAVNMTDLNSQINNQLGTVANDSIPPNVPPTGSHDPSIATLYSYNPDKAASLLLDAMMHPLTVFHMRNGAPAPVDDIPKRRYTRLLPLSAASSS